MIVVDRLPRLFRPTAHFRTKPETLGVVGVKLCHWLDRLSPINPYSSLLVNKLDAN